ncbi:MAG: serine hydrolase [Pyrinomonadaceae bacterium]|nr:serine hydrolase [Pyrinomonadaceae bacterium]
MNTPKSTGEAWDKLEEKVDSLVEALIEEKSLPGMTVAVTKGGRLILSKGYGYALVDGTRKLPMKPCMRSKIGSVSKTITGAAAFQLMKSKNIDPKSQKLYGLKGFFGGIFDADIDIGIKAHAPKSAQWKKWYEKITIQNLLDHKAGFTRSSGDTKDVAKMFGVSEDEVTLEQEHRYFLRTRELLHEPGTESEYSNHGFGLWALLIKKMSGKPYADYVREDYLRPIKLHNAVRPQRANPDSCDAYGHKFNNNQKPEALPFEESTLGMGLAAGGFTSSAQNVLGLTASLDKKYTTAELDSMGWSGNAKGRLSHSGSIDGGLAYVVMFPDGYRTSTENLDLSEVHVAVAANIRGGDLSSGDLKSLTDEIAVAVPASNVPATFDIWKQGKSVCSCEYARHGVPANQYQQVFDEAAQSGYRLEWIDGYTDDGKAHFNVIFRTNEQGIAWVSHHDMTGTTYQQNFDKYRDEGFSLDHVDSYVVGKNVLYAAIWTKSSGAFTAYHGSTAEEHQKSFDSLTSAGWRPKVISVASVSGKLRYTALYTKQAIGSFEARSFLTPAEYQTKFDQNKASGRHLHYLNSYLHEGTLRFSAIWAEKPDVSGSKANHGLTAEQFLTRWEDAMSAGFRTRAITGCEEGGKVRYAVYWTK